MSGNFAIKGGGVGRLIANAILNFHFDFPHPSLNNTAGQSASCDRVLFFGQCSTLQWFYCFQSGRLILQTCGKGILPGDQTSQYAWRMLLWAWVDVNILYLSLFPYVFVFVSLSICLCVSVFEYLCLVKSCCIIWSWKIFCEALQRCLKQASALCTSCIIRSAMLAPQAMTSEEDEN